MALSVIVALILTPALCATMLKPIEKGDHGEHKGGFFWLVQPDVPFHHPRLRAGRRSLSIAPYLLISW